MRIVHILLTKSFAGTERHVLELASAQAKAGHEVMLVLRRKAAQTRKDAIAHRVDPSVRVELVNDVLARWCLERRVRNLVRKLRPDIAHAHLGWACRTLRGLQGPFRVATLHFEYIAEQHSHLDGLVAIAPWQMSAIPESLRVHSRQIDNWTRSRSDADQQAVAEIRDRLRAEHGIRPDEFLFGALGRTVTSKGMDVLIESFSRTRLPGARLAIVGQGKQWKDLRERAGVNVVMPGFVERTEDWLAAFDCFVSPAREEPFGLVLLEAMEAGLPIIATRTEGATHLSSLMGCSLVPVDNISALSQALDDAWRQSPSRKKYALDPFRVDAKAGELESFYLQGISSIKNRRVPVGIAEQQARQYETE